MPNVASSKTASDGSMNTCTHHTQLQLLLSTNSRCTVYQLQVCCLPAADVLSTNAGSLSTRCRCTVYQIQMYRVPDAGMLSTSCRCTVYYLQLEARSQAEPSKAGDTNAQEVDPHRVKLQEED